ncbi:MAG: hypothetical protein Q4F43_10445, partial [Eubacteriales bacterium]|nr:hypothetical protein [Eubacteriales bacterium]
MKVRNLNGDFEENMLTKNTQYQGLRGSTGGYTERADPSTPADLVCQRRKTGGCLTPEITRSQSWLYFFD